MNAPKANLFKYDMLALALLRIGIFFLLLLPSPFRQNLDKNINQISDSNSLADFNNVNKKILPQKILPKNSPQIILQKILQKVLPKKIPPKTFLQKKNPPKNPKKNTKKHRPKIPPKSKEFPKNFSKISNLENTQSPTWHMEAKNSFGLVWAPSYNCNKTVGIF